MNFIKALFGKKESPIFSTKYGVEYYPLSKKYYALRNGNYLKKDRSTGIIEARYGILNDVAFADDFDSKEEAIAFIEKAKEQIDKVKVIYTEC